MCRMWQFLAILSSFFHSSLLCTFSCHHSPPTILPPSLTSSCHLFLGLPFNLVVPKFIHNTLLGIIFSSILCTCPHQHNLFNLTVSIMKVKQSQYRPGGAQRVLRKLRFPDFVTTAQDGGRLSALCTSRLYPQEILLVLISVRGWLEEFFVNLFECVNITNTLSCSCA